ncbi:precorrin-2 C(20)-methyltransferase [filamentous cyanobacterium LEGE 11480]|uniref:Precorrin-2 C(20)-methyltransferase n=1 Tax=Romeriopsis navalis LEGE 11480 TaxID=2777977 RepID=A0A928Z2A9_9CYAN|nr:precorrin-2 C(20)-methyltransferase [Romeriopsis navalis]MBE9030211.1 precorrin-2 C(20)-methyltransferase [Romeriopsis navalis LEGE 11480]
MTETKMGTLYGIGLGPGDPELLTLKGYRILQSVPIVAYPKSPDGRCISRSIVADYLKPEQTEIGMDFPFKLAESSQPKYDYWAGVLAEHLAAGQDIAVLCEGDPFFFGTFMYLFNRLSPQFPTEIIPGVSSVMASASMLRTPLTYRNDVFTVLSGILPAEKLTKQLQHTDAAVVMKLGRNFEKVRNVLKDVGLIDRALFVERATTDRQRIVPILEVDPAEVPYFSIIVIPSEWDWAKG